MSDSEKTAPCSIEHERALLGAILVEGDQGGKDVIGKVVEALKTHLCFYAVEHQHIYRAMIAAHTASKPITTLTVLRYIKDDKYAKGEVSFSYLESLVDIAAPIGTEDESLEVVFDKYIARRAISMGHGWSERVLEDGISEAKLVEISQDVQSLAAAASSFLGSHPRNLKSPMEFEQGFIDHWLRNDEEFGRDLWFGFPLRIRPSESTLFTGDNGSGKTSFLSQLTIHLAMQGARVMVASMEVQAATSLWLMSRQLLGTNRLPMEVKDNKETVTDEGMKQMAKALMWLEDKIWLYDFQGITDWREVLDTARYAKEKKGADVLIVDSVMRIGIADDDYAQQGLAASRFADFSVKEGVHTFLVVHENKGDSGNVKSRVRGSKQWTDNAHNVIGISRNQRKAEQTAELKSDMDAGIISQDEADERWAKLDKLSDSKFVLAKQRWPSSRQNASKHLWFDHPSCQFRDTPHGARGVNLLQRALLQEKRK